MKAALIQRQISLNEQILTGLYEEYGNLRNARKEINEEVDRLVIEAHAEQGEAHNLQELSKQYSSYIRKFKKKIAAVEEIQRMLKSELKGLQSIEAWVEMDDVEWHGLVKMAQQEDYQVTYSYDQLAEMFGEE